MILSDSPKISLTNGDCMEYLKGYADNYFQLSIVDVPYGIGFGKFNRTNKDSNGVRYKADKYKNSDWDNNIPKDEYQKELLRVSKNQIAWGGNYFPFLAKKKSPNLKTIQQFKAYIAESTENWIFWYKQNPLPNFADGELAWNSFGYNNQFNYRYYGNLEGNTSASSKYHPTQKPVRLYEWLLMNYAKEGDKILDTHAGSFSIGIACHYMGFDLEAFELDKDYYEASLKRFKEQTAQITMF